MSGAALNQADDNGLCLSRCATTPQYVRLTDSLSQTSSFLAHPHWVFDLKCCLNGTSLVPCGGHVQAPGELTIWSPRRNSCPHCGSTRTWRSCPTADQFRPFRGGLDLLSPGQKEVTLSGPPLRDRESLGKGGAFLGRGFFRGRRRLFRSFLADPVSTRRQLRRLFVNRRLLT